MYSLYLTYSENILWLHGPDAPAHICGALRSPAAPLARPDGSCDEVIDLHLQGSPADLERTLEELEACLALVEHQIVPVTLGIVLEAGSEPWFSPLLAGQLEYIDHGSASRARGAQKLRLSLRRAEFWQRAALPVPLSNANGSGVTDGLQVENHTDLAHQCWVDVETRALEGNYPVPARIEIANTLESGGQLENIWLGCYVGAGEPPSTVLEGEYGLTLLGTSVIADTASSNGQFRRVNWNSSGEATLIQWTLTSAQLAAFAGQWARPLVRLANSISATDVWLQLRVLINAEVSGTSNWMLLQPGQKLQDLPAIQLPPWPLPQETAPAPLTLALVASRVSSLPLALDLDFIQLMPTDGWRKYLALQPMNFGSTLVDDFAQSACYTQEPGTGARVQHAVVGADVLLWPGRRQRIYLMHGGTACDIAYRTRLKLAYTPRRRVI